MISNAVSAKKRSELDDLFKDYVPQQLEEQQKMAVQNSTLALLIDSYRRILNSRTREEPWKDNAEFKAISRQGLSPLELDIFLQATSPYEQHPRNKKILGHYLTHLLQHSYNAGFNDFILHPYMPIDDLGRSECFPPEKEEAPLFGGTAKNPLRFIVFGDVGISCGQASKNVQAIIHGNSDIFLGMYAQQSSFDVQKCCTPGMDAKNSTFTGIFSFSFSYNGDPTHCTFKTREDDCLIAMLKRIPKGNKIVHIRAEAEEMKRGYDD